MDLISRVIQLENELRRLITQWDRYFGGDLRVPPTLEREHLARRLRLVAEQQPQRSADAFRLEQLQHRFMAYSANWERMLREREEGVRRWLPGRPRAKAGTSPTSPVNGVDPASVNGTGTPTLFDRWRQAKEGLGHEVKMDRGAFERQLRRQRRELEQRLGYAVEFEVKVDDGRVKLAARKAVRATAGG